MRHIIYGDRDDIGRLNAHIYRWERQRKTGALLPCAIKRDIGNLLGACGSHHDGQIDRHLINSTHDLPLRHLCDQVIIERPVDIKVILYYLKYPVFHPLIYHLKLFW